jgi:hypothetical protein
MDNFLQKSVLQVHGLRGGRVLACLSLLALVGCAAPKADSPLVGADRDAHGCIASAGYLWDATQQKCARPWEK